MSEKKRVTFYSNPKLDYLFGFLGGKPAPTKKDSFKPLKGLTITTEEGKTLKNIYQKKPSNKSVKEFQSSVAEMAKSVIEENIIEKSEVEVILSFSITPNRYKNVDVDNLAKTVLDSLTGIAFEDDAQVSSLICNKFIHENKNNSLFIGITELTEKRKGFIDDIALFSTTKWEAYKLQIPRRFNRTRLGFGTLILTTRLHRLNAESFCLYKIIPLCHN